VNDWRRGNTSEVSVKETLERQDKQDWQGRQLLQCLKLENNQNDAGMGIKSRRAEE